MAVRASSSSGEFASLGPSSSSGGGGGGDDDAAGASASSGSADSGTPLAGLPDADPDAPAATAALAAPPRPAPGTGAEKTVSCLSSIRMLRHAPRELWLLMVLKVLESYGYFSMSLSLTVFLSDEFGFTDTEAGVMYGTWGLLISVFGLITGIAVDMLGVRRALIVGSVLSTAGRFWLTVAQSRWEVYTVLFGVLPLGLAFGIPVLTIGVKRYTNSRTRTFAFSVFYAMMNISALVSGAAVDLCRMLVPAEGISVGGTVFSELRVLFFTGTLTTLLMVAVSSLGFREINVNARGETEEFKLERPPLRKFLGETCKDTRFWRLMLFTLLIVLVRLVFRHLDATFPKYLVRSQEDPDAPYGSIYAINPATIIVLVPLIGAYASHIHPFKMILYGSIVSALSVFWLVVGPYIWTSVMFVVTLSLGEAVYSPRVYEYSMLLAPVGREGLYTSLASAPMFVAKLFAGGISGMLLQEYCPAEGPRDCEFMWLIIGLITISGPIMMVLLRNVIQPDGTDKPMLADDDVERSGGGDGAESDDGTVELTSMQGQSGLLAGADSGEADAMFERIDGAPDERVGGGGGGGARGGRGGASVYAQVDSASPAGANSEGGDGLGDAGTKPKRDRRRTKTKHGAARASL